jgi:hypothetical protein
MGSNVGIFEMLRAGGGTLRRRSPLGRAAQAVRHFMMESKTRLRELPGQGYLRLEYGVPTVILPKRS